MRDLKYRRYGQQIDKLETEKVARGEQETREARQVQKCDRTIR